VPDEEDVRDEDPTADLGDSHTSASTTPWYLQVEAPQRVSNPLLERQRIPKLPPDPPRLLKPILEHISIDLGLDDLTLFDVRDINPPPALGANLLMILGTARSEKHLHVSADRFCRWLKVTHKISPSADGLLGRGELKLKLRRKARRARLLSNVGSSETGNADDGLRTGWICVNIGTIEDGRNPVEGFAGQEGYVGFGNEAGGAKVVIQMLTQEKRDELDLEDLWGKMLRRHERKEDRISRGQEDPLPEQEVGQSSLSGKLAVSDLRSSLFASLPIRSVINFNQIRLYHRPSTSSAADITPVDIDYQGPRVFRYTKKAEQPRMARTNSETNTDNGKEGEALPGITAKLTTLSAHIHYLQSLPLDVAIKALGVNARDHASTPFLKSFYHTQLRSPIADVLENRLALICHGIAIRHLGYTKRHLIESFNGLQSRSPNIPEKVFYRTFDAFLTLDPLKRANKRWPTISKESMFDAIMILHAMSSRGHDIQTDRIRKMLRKALKQNFRSRGGSLRRSDVHHLRMLIDRLNSSLNSSPSYAVCLRMLIESFQSQTGVSAQVLYREFKLSPQDPHSLRQVLVHGCTNAQLYR